MKKLPGLCREKKKLLPGKTKIVKSLCASHLLRLSCTMETAEAFKSEFRTLVDELRKGGGMGGAAGAALASVLARVFTTLGR